MDRRSTRAVVGLTAATTAVIAVLVGRGGDEPAPRDVRAVKQAVLRHLDGDLALARGTTMPPYAEVRARSIHVPGRVRSEVAWLRKTMRIQAAHPEFVFDDERVVIDRWTDVDIGNGRAHVVAEGRERYHLVRTGRWRSNPSRWTLDLVRDAGAWKLARLRWAPLDGP